METKKCNTCKKILELKFFYKRLKNPDGIDHRCKECDKLAQKRCRKVSPDVYRLNQQTEAKRAYRREYYNKRRNK